MHCIDQVTNRTQHQTVWVMCYFANCCSFFSRSGQTDLGFQTFIDKHTLSKSILDWLWRRTTSLDTKWIPSCGFQVTLIWWFFLQQASEWLPLQLLPCKNQCLFWIHGSRAPPATSDPTSLHPGMLRLFSRRKGMVQKKVHLNLHKIYSHILLLTMTYIHLHLSRIYSRNTQSQQHSKFTCISTTQDLQLRYTQLQPTAHWQHCSASWKITNSLLLPWKTLLCGLFASS